VHPPVGKAVFTLGRRFATSGAKQIALTFVALGVTILAAYLLFILVERPSQRWSSSFKYKRRARVEPDAYGGGMDSSAAEELALP
jgi:peptidoglycan/LPS O-acetylase OafA/YrhL